MPPARASLAAALALVAGLEAGAATKLDSTIASRARRATDVALSALRTRELRADGSYGDALATALVLRAFLESHRRYTEEDGPYITRPIEFLSAKSSPDARWVTRLAFLRTSKKPDSSSWPRELTAELGPPSKLSAPADLAFAVEAVVVSGAPDESFFRSAVAAASASGATLASTYVRALAAKSGYGNRETAAGAIASECAGRNEGPPSAERDYFLAASMAALPEVAPADCSGALAEDILSRQQFEGFWKPEEEGSDKARATALALLALAKLLSIG